MQKAKQVARVMGVEVEIIDWEVNRGKREGMAECVRRTNSEVVIFIDSDSFIEKDTVKELIKYFTLNKVGAVTAHTHVYNADHNVLTKLQTIHYYVSFKAFKSAESLFGSVTCCPGCCTAYKTEYIKPYIDEWCRQSFLGVTCTYGDDRALTNYLLKNGHNTIYSPTANAYTIAPDKMKTFFRQQLRWKKSWTRETLLASKYFWKRNPIMVFIFYIGMVLTFLTPLIIFRALVWYPLVMKTLPWSYFFGLFLMSGVFSLYYRVYTGDRRWFYGFLYSFFYSLVLNWQMFYALATLRDTKWGTR
jgi:hyaluronan synthase